MFRRWVPAPLLRLVKPPLLRCQKCPLLMRRQETVGKLMPVPEIVVTVGATPGVPAAPTVTVSVWPGVTGNG